MNLPFYSRVRCCLKLLLCIAIFALCVPSGFSQEITGSIQGTVKDPGGAAVAGATVTASSPALVRPVETTTDSEGLYIFSTLSSGVYTITVSQTGFSSVKKEEINLQLGRELTLDLALAVGNVAETVTVTSSAEAIDVTSSNTNTSLSEEFIERSPRGRTFDTLLKAVPGVRAEPKSGNEGVGGISVDGASGAENAFIIDGVEVTDVRKGQLRRADAIPFEFVREVQVKSGGFEAEFGGATGGVINVVTRSGSNEFHGEAAYSQTGGGLNSNVRGFWQLNPAAVSQADFFRQREDDYRVSYPGGTVSGPIIKDRLNFFTSYFPEFIRTERTLNYTSGARTFQQNISRHYGLARLDFAPASKVQFNTSYIWTPTKVTGILPNADPRVAAPTNDLSIQGGYTPSSAYTAAVTYTPTPKLIISSRFGYKYLNDKGSQLNSNFTATGSSYGLPGNAFLFYQSNTSQQTSPAVPAQFAGNRNFQNISSNFLTLRDVTTRHNVYLDATYITDLFGQQHQFKGGYALNRLFNDVEDDYLNGRFDIFWGEAFSRGSITDARGAYGYYIWEDGVRHNAKASSRNQGFYFQDAWRAHPRLTLNLGVRFENEFLPPYTPEVNGIKVANPITFGFGDKVAPRIGVAWDVLGNGSWKLSGSFGRYFDVMKYELARGSFGGDYWHSRVYRLDNPNINQLGKANPSASGSLIIDFDNRTIPINAQGELEGIDPGIKPYESREFSITSEHQLKANMVVSARYTRKRLIRAIEDIGILDETESEVYVIGNPGFGQRSSEDNNFAGIAVDLKPGVSLVPKARREYDAVEFRLDQRFTSGIARNFSYLASYTYSRLYGNFAGLANSDENGRSDPSVSRAFDLPYGNFDQNGNNVYGRLATDRPHTFTFFGNYVLNTRVGATNFALSQVAYSGSPITSEATVIVPVFYNGRGDLGRTDAFTQTDLQLSHTIPLKSERVSLKFDANFQNLFNQAAVLNVRSRLNRSGNITTLNGNNIETNPAGIQAFFGGGFNVPALIGPTTASTLARDPTYGLPGTRRSGLTPEGSNAYQGIREIRLGVRLIF